MIGRDVPGEVRIRRIRPDEGELLRATRLRGLEETPEAFGQSLEEALARPAEEWRTSARAASVGDRRIWLLAERQDDALPHPAVVGLVLGRRRPPDTVMLFSMWVDPDARRAGIGRQLIEELEQWAAGWGAIRTVLWVFAGNEPAIRFYQRLGFEIVEDGADALTGAQYGAHAMSRQIGHPG